MTTTLAELLEVNMAEIPRVCTRALTYLERCWQEAGRPTEREILIEFLDSKLRFCTEVQYRYPKIVLKRLKQLQRSEWRPRGETIQ